MRTETKLIEEIEMVGTQDEWDEAFKVIKDGKYTITRSGALRLSLTRVDPKQFCIRGTRTINPL